MRTIKGSCHCGAVTFEAGFDGEVQTSKCNCSICTKSRFWKVIVPAEAFELKRGENVLQTYRFGSEHILHRTCSVCGVKVFGTVSVGGTDLVAVSVPCLDLEPAELAALPVSFEDGRNDNQEAEPDITSYL